MLKVLLQIVTCNQWPKHKPIKNEEFSFPLMTPEDDTRQDPDYNPIKDVQIYGDSLMGCGIGKEECQDSFYIQSRLTPITYFFAVYDGHGSSGKAVSNFVNEQFGICLKINADKIERLIANKCINTFFHHAFRIIEGKLRKSRVNSYTSGTCCNLVLISGGKCFIANLGDSRAVLCRQVGPQNFKTIDLSQDHKPTRPDEKERILSMGGIIEAMEYEGEVTGPLRVWTKDRDIGIAMTRAIGDSYGKKAGLISDPEITEINLQAGDKFIIIASDGVWDVMTSKEAVDFVLNYGESGKPKQKASKALVQEAQKRWDALEEGEENPYRDDITVVIAYPEFYSSKSSTETSSSSTIQIEQR